MLMQDHDSLMSIGRRFFVEQDRQRGPLAADLIAPSYTATIGGNPPMDQAGHDGFGRGFFAAFPDLHHEIELVLADGDHVFVRFMLHGTHQAAFFGIPATNKRIAVAAHAVLEVRDGRVTRLRGVFDEAGMLRQLGVLPS
jgi:steroid delta-isomerase-like uncharacterized protein